LSFKCFRKVREGVTLRRTVGVCKLTTPKETEYETMEQRYFRISLGEAILVDREEGKLVVEIYGKGTEGWW
jgi:hypothetical protein